MQFTVSSETELINRVFEIIKADLAPGFRVGLIGDLGAGKTALVRGIINKIIANQEVTSSTFVLRKTYESEKLKIQHIDLYRLPKDSVSQEVNEWIADQEYLTFVEWPENISLKPKAFQLLIKINIQGKNKRIVELEWI